MIKLRTKNGDVLVGTRVDGGCMELAVYNKSGEIMAKTVMTSREAFMIINNALKNKTIRPIKPEEDVDDSCVYS